MPEPGHRAQDYRRIYLNAMPAWKRWFATHTRWTPFDRRAAAVLHAHFSSPFEYMTTAEIEKLVADAIVADVMKEEEDA